MDADERVAAVILAAGASTRFGAPKALARVGSRTLLGVAADAATAARLSPVLAVVPPGAAVPASVEPVRNDAPEAGMSRSLQLGLAALPPSAEAAVVMLVDQPTVDAALLRRIVGARGPRPVVATRAGELLAPPVLIEREAFELAGRVRGDIGLRAVLREHPSLVRGVDLDAPVPDVDVPADLDRVTQPCPGCGARYLAHALDESHPYIGASPACWAAYGELLAREFGNAAYGRAHRHSADVYAVQHPGVDGRRQRQSVALHLVALCAWLEQGHDVPRLNRDTLRLATDEREWPWLAPPAPPYGVTVLDVLEARDGAAHERLVRRWAESTWSAWAAHHATVRDWVAELTA